MKKNIKYSGLFLLIYMLMILILSMGLFYFKISITKFNMIISLFLSIIVFYFFSKKINIEKKTMRNSIIMAVLIVIISSLFMSFIFDRSSDGNTYHKDAVGNLYNGWNPVYESTDTFVENKLARDDVDMQIWDIWKDHYAKANWILEANVYKTFGNIEAGKSINIIFMYILFSLCFSYLIEKLDLKKTLIISLLLTFNPISCAQIFSFYNDQLSGTILIALIISLISINDFTDKTNIMEKFTWLSCLFIIILNIKFNALGYACVFTFLFMIKYLYTIYKKNNDKFKKIFIRLVILFVSLFSISLLYIGYPTYIKNMVDHGNPFYPVYGDEKVDIITAQEPKDFIKMNTISKFFYGTFTKVNNLRENDNYKVKIPFSISKSEITDTASIDCRLSGFGVWFSGILIVSLIIIGIYLYKSKETKEKNNIILTLVGLGILILIISESWWARYNPQNYIIAIIALYILFKYNSKKIFNYIFTIILIINSGLILGGNSMFTLKNSINIYKDLSSLKNKEINISFNNGISNGILYNYDDFNIKYNIGNDSYDKKMYFDYINYEVENEK